MERRCLKLVYATLVMLLLLLLHINPSSSTMIRCIESERQALLAIKQGFVQKKHYLMEPLPSWVGTETENTDCCTWKGVYCNNQTGHVTKLHLGHQFLKGTISPKLVELQHLKYLNLSLNDFNGNQIPEFIGSLTNLRFLDLSWSSFGGQIPYQIGNLTHLQYLDLRSNHSIHDKNLNWLSHLSSLKYLDLSGVLLSNVSDWLKTVSQLPSLTNLALSECDLPPPIFLSSLSHINSSRSLASIDLSYNYNTVTSSIFKWLCNYNTSIVHLDLSSTNLSGSIPDVLENMSSLAHLYLSSTNLSGSIPDVFANMSSLAELDLSYNNLEGEIPPSFSKLCSLQLLGLSNNSLTGKIPESIGQMLSLKKIILYGNQFSGIPESIGKLSKLEVLSLSMNSLEGVISKTHFSELSKLRILDLSFNSLVFEIPSDWVPPFQLNYIILRSCKMGPYFPKWLQTQKNYSYLDLSNTGISDILPSWFWGSYSKLIFLDLSHNQIRGTISNTTLEFDDSAEVHLSSNQFEGPIPSFLSKAHYLDLSNNKISGLISFFCASAAGTLTFLNLSSNHLSGELPDCWTPLKNLVMLDLSYNVLSGKIPTTMASLIRLETLKFRSNRFVGELPSSLKNCRNLQVIDLGDNVFSGSIPEWLGDSLPNLVILLLQSNHFSGSLPPQLCHLQYIKIFDFSVNNISGSIPKCLNNLTTLAQTGNSTPTIYHTYVLDVITRNSDRYEDDATFIWKGRMTRYKNTLGLVKIIDLSSNKLTGEIPIEITHLVGLVSLNLSRNYLTGHVPQEIGKLQSLDSLDLSRNHIDGRIPTSLSRIDRLGFLDLSYNNLSGEIPKGTQLQGYDPSVYAGNPQLCGLPLPKMCADPEQTGPDQSTVFGKQEDKDELISRGTYTSMGVGFAVGFWGACGSLIFNRSWRYTYFNFFNILNDWIYVRVALIRRKLWDD